MSSNYFRASLSSKTNEIVCYKAFSFEWLISFGERFNSGLVGAGVKLYRLEEDYNPWFEDFKIKKGEVVRLNEADGMLSTIRTVLGKTSIVSRQFGKNKVGRIPWKILYEVPRHEWTCEHVCEYVIKPACEKNGSYYVDLIASEDPELVQENDFENGTFISYARRMTFHSYISALKSYFRRSRQILPSQAYVWTDLFCANQIKLTDSTDAEAQKLYYELLNKGLHMAISRFDHKVLIIDDWERPTPLTRAWCVWELFGIVDSGSDVEIAMPVKVELNYLETLRRNNQKVMNAWSTVDVASAKCFNPEDLKMIKRAIEQRSSNEAINHTVVAALKNFHLTVAQVEIEDATPKAMEIKYRLLMAVASSMKQMGQGENGEKFAQRALDIKEKGFKFFEQEYVKLEKAKKKGMELRKAGKLDESQKVLEQVCSQAEVQFQIKYYGKDELGFTYTDQKDYARAEACFSTYLTWIRRRWGDLNGIEKVLDKYSVVLLNLDKKPQAEVVLREMINELGYPGRKSVVLARGMCALAFCLWSYNEMPAKYLQASNLADEALGMFEECGARKEEMKEWRGKIKAYKKRITKS